MNKKYTTIEKKYLAEALSFLGFKYYKYGEGKEIEYSFEETDKFKFALGELLKLRNKLNNR